MRDELSFTLSDEELDAIADRLTERVADAVIERLSAAKRSSAKERRDLAAEIAAFLHNQPGSTTSEIAAGVGARKAAVTARLEVDSQFRRVPPRSGRPHNAKAWALASNPPALFPDSRNSTPEDKGEVAKAVGPAPRGRRSEEAS